MMVDETSPNYEGWRVALASGVGVCVSFASLLVYTFGIFLKPLAEEFSWSRESVSAAFGIAAMMVAVCSPPLGYLLDRIHPRRISRCWSLRFGDPTVALPSRTRVASRVQTHLVSGPVIGAGRQPH